MSNELNQERTIHIDAKNWRANWLDIRPGPRGGQGTGKIVAGRSNGIQTAFLKILNRQRDIERRKRAYREVVALETVTVPGVPRVVETNAHYHADQSYDLYLVTEFIQGRTLSEVVESGPVSMALGLVWMHDLCEILAHCHTETVLHRDIKPDNIIIGPREDEPEHLHLVDFGQAFAEGSSVDFATPDAQEMGNRFLHLSELQGNSENKQDARSDVTMAVGILFYILTAEWPVNLLDQSSRMPHQRPGPRARLETAGFNTIRLLNLFDTGFAQSIDQRFQSIEEFRRYLGGLNDPKLDDGVSEIERTTSRIRERLASQSRRNAEAARAALSLVLKHIDHINLVVVSDFGNALVTTQTGYGINASEGTATNGLGFQLAHDPTKEFRPLYQVTISGAEIILVVTAPDIPPLTERIPFGRGLPQDAVDRVRAYLIAGLEQLLL